MAIAYITIDRTKSLGNDLLQVANQIRSHRAILKAHLAYMGNMNDGVDYASLEAMYGLPTGQGAAVLTILADSITKMESANIDKLLASLVPST